jgi:hypothetical protein
MTKARDLANGATALSAVSATELAYLDGVTSAVQTQIDGKQAVNAAVSTTELGYLDGVTSAIQTQLDAKIAKTLTTTTGDIIYASGANTPARLGIGSTSNVLTVAGGVPTWAAPAGDGFAGCGIYNSANVNISNNTVTRYNCDSEMFDTSSFHDTSTNTARITVPAGKAGYYLVVQFCAWTGLAAGAREQLRLYKNGAFYQLTDSASVGTAIDNSIQLQTVLNLSVGDYLETFVYQNSGSTLNLNGGAAYTAFIVQYLGA